MPNLSGLWVKPKILRPHVLHFYIVLEYLKAFSMALLACTLVMLMAFLIQKASEFENYGVSFGQVTKLSPFFIPAALTYAFPLATMIAAIVVFGRMAAENEIQAAQAGGASIGVLAFPVLCCSVFFSAASLWCNDTGLEWGFQNVRYHVLNLQNPDLLAKWEKPGGKGLH